MTVNIGADSALYPRASLYCRPEHYRNIEAELRAGADAIGAAADAYELAQEAAAETVPTVEESAYVEDELGVTRNREEEAAA